MKKKLKSLLILLLIIGVTIIGKNYCYAAEVQYTDNVIPAMTSDTAPSGVASASSVYNADGYYFPAYLAFDHNNSYLNGWVSENGKTTGTLGYEFSVAKCITKYSMVSRTISSSKEYSTVVSQLPKNWTFEAWDEQAKAWVVLDTRSNITDWTYSQKKEFIFINSKSYKKYQINITQNNGYASNTTIGEVEMMTTASTPTATVGQSLTSPEDGWRRYDDSDPLIKYDGRSWRHSDTIIPGRYNGSASATGTGGDKIIIKFYGTKIRIISENFSTHSSLGITIDGGTQDTASISSYNTRICQFLCYEKLNLSLGFHTIIVTNLGNNTGEAGIDAIDIDATGYLVSDTQPANLIATAGDKSVSLKWEQVSNATGYMIRYGTTPGTYDKSISVSADAFNGYNVSGLTNGTKYYFVVSAIISGKESSNSNEASATPKSESVYSGNKAILEIVMTNGTIKEYDLTMDEIDKFLTWYDNRSDGTGKSYYRIIKRSNVKPFNSRYEYLQFDKLYSFEVKDYNDK
jgi:Fibronectin type III domain.